MRFVSAFVSVLAAVFFVVDPVFAQEAAGEATRTALGLDAIAAGIGIGIAVFGGAIGQGKAAAAALESIGRNPGAAGALFNPFIIALALIESLVLLGFVVTFVGILG